MGKQNKKTNTRDRNQRKKHPLQIAIVIAKNAFTTRNRQKYLIVIIRSKTADSL